MARILLVGTATLDLVFGLDHHPARDEEMRASSLRTCRGGNAANSAVVLARLGHAPEFLGVLADAPETAVIEKDFSAHGVAYQHCPRVVGKPPTSSIYLVDASRSIVHYRDLPELDARHFVQLDLAAYDWIHFEGRNVPQLVDMLVHVRRVRPDMPVSVELEKPREGVEDVFGLAGLLMCSSGFARHHGFSDPCDFLRWMEMRAPQARVIVAWGEAGAYGVDETGGVCHAPAMPPSHVVDTLGAGDTFNAAMIDGMLRGMSLGGVIDHACRLAGAKCGCHGFNFAIRQLPVS